MKSIIEYSKLYWEQKSIINESFESSILREIRDQLNETIKQNKEYNEERGWEYKDTKNTFKKVFGSESVKWNEIKDENFKECSKDNDEDIKLAKRIFYRRNNQYPGLIILLNSNEDGPKYLGMMICVGGWNGSYFSFTSGKRYYGDKFKPADVEGFLTKKFLIIDLSNVNTFKLQDDRRNAKWGTFNLYNDPKERDETYEKIAKENNARYNKILAKIKADKNSDDGVAEKVSEYVKKVMECSIKISHDPIRYAKDEWKVQELLKLVYDKAQYFTPRIGKPYTTGTNGIIYLYDSYLTAKLKMAKGNSYSSDYDERDFNTAKKSLETVFAKIDEKLKIFNDEE